MGWIIRIILILIVIRILWRIIAGPFRRPKNARRPPESLPLVRDPVCGKFVLPDRAIRAGAGESVVYFCSAECRDKYDGARS
jgi:YHS domain-containing protein